jgi:hypothetical protein
MIQNNQEKIDANLKEMKEKLMERLEAKIEAEIETSNGKFEVRVLLSPGWVSTKL